MWSEQNGGPLDYLAWLPEGIAPDAGYGMVVLLHGYGSNRDDLTNLAETLHATGYVHILPNAPLEAFTGFDPTARAWFERGGKESVEGVTLARSRLQAMLDEVRAKYATPPGRVVLIGFSQGGNLAIRHGLPAPEAFAGVACLAGSLTRPEELTPELPAARGQRVFIAHGYRDMVVPFHVARDLADYLQRHGYPPEFRAYTIGHMLSKALVDDLRGWLVATLPPARGS